MRSYGLHHVCAILAAALIPASIGHGATCPPPTKVSFAVGMQDITFVDQNRGYVVIRAKKPVTFIPDLESDPSTTVVSGTTVSVVTRTTVTWDFGDKSGLLGQESGAKPAHSYAEGGKSYTVTLRASNVCFDNATSAERTITKTLYISGPQTTDDGLSLCQGAIDEHAVETLNKDDLIYLIRTMRSDQVRRGKAAAKIEQAKDAISMIDDLANEEVKADEIRSVLRQIDDARNQLPAHEESAHLSGFRNMYEAISVEPKLVSQLSDTQMKARKKHNRSDLAKLGKAAMEDVKSSIKTP